MIFLGYVTPYSSKKKNKIELANEVFLLSIMYHIFCFTDFMRDEQTRYYVGYSCLTVNLLLLAFNIFFIFKEQFRIVQH